MRWQPNRRVGVHAPQPDLPFEPPPWRRSDRQSLRDGLFVAMMTTSWIAGNALAVLGCVVATFLLIAQGDFNVFMAQIDNIAARFIAAPPDRQASFEHEAAVTLALIGIALILIRLPRFVVRLRLELAQEDGHADRNA